MDGSLFPMDVERSQYGVVPASEPSIYERVDAQIEARARRKDANSSHEAAARHNRSGKASKNAAIVLRLVRLSPGLTSVELHASQDASDLERHEVSRRLSDLEHAGKVRKGPERECTVGRGKMLTWWPVEDAG